MEMVKIKKSKLIDVSAIVIAIILLSYYLGSTIRLLTSKETLLKREKKEEKKIVAKTLQDYAVLVDKNIFGVKGINFSVIEKKDLQQTSVDTSGFKLKGVITFYPGYAFIENKEGKQMLFKLGDDVFSAGKLALVSKDHVYISQGSGGFQIILEGVVKEEKKISGSTPGMAMQSIQSPSQSQTFNREQIKRFLEDPKEIMTDARLLPNLVDGKQQGFVVREVKPNGFYDNIGLKNGDIILRANGIELTSPSDGIKIFNLLKELDKVELDLMRDGAKKTLVYHIN